MSTEKESIVATGDASRRINDETAALPSAFSRSLHHRRACRFALWCLAAAATAAAAGAFVVSWKEHRGPILTGGSPLTTSGAIGFSFAARKGLGRHGGATEATVDPPFPILRKLINGPQAAAAITDGQTRRPSLGEVVQDLVVAAQEERYNSAFSPTMMIGSRNSRRGLRVLQDVGLELSESTAIPEDGSAGGVGGAEGFPALKESTLMFLHVFKCAGSTLRRMLVEWAEVNGERGAIVHQCDYLKVLAAIDPDLIQLFNRSLALQWEVYEKGVSLWDVRCRQALPATMHEEMCTVPPAPETYQ